MAGVVIVDTMDILTTGDEATAALPEDIEEVNHAPRDEAAESGPHGYYGWGGYGWGGYRGYYGYPYYRGYGWYGRKKRNAEETIGDDISEGEEEAGPNPHYGYYYGGYRPWGYRGYGWGGYWGGYGYPYWG